MPVILGPNDYDLWLDPEVQAVEELSYMFEPYDSQEMRVDPVSTHVNSVRNDDPECIEIEQTLF